MINTVNPTNRNINTIMEKVKKNEEHIVYNRIKIKYLHHLFIVLIFILCV